MVLEQIRHLDKKKKAKKTKKLNLICYRETNTKWIIDLKVKHKVI